MYIDLTGLEGFTYYGKNAYAIVENGAMRIVGQIAYEKLMFCACYRKHGLVCAYCGSTLDKGDKTVDHKIPKAYGGVSILDNLVPACSKCNEEKSDLFFEEYVTLRTIQEKNDKKNYRSECIEKHKYEFSQRGACIPVEWIETEPQEVLVDFDFTTDFNKCSKYIKIEEFFKKFGKLPKALVISGNNRLIDGFNVLMFAKNEGIKNVPTIKLKNIIIEKL